MKNLITGIILFSLLTTAYSQTGTITGKITDSSGKKTLSLATITIFQAKDTSIITYRLSTETGEFRVPGLPTSVPLRLIVSYSGLSAYRKEFTITPAQLFVNMGVLKMNPSSNTLNEVIVFAERPPVSVKNDTIEFNASAFKTLPTALLEDLLKKLPGVQVDENGNIKVNGQVVNRLLVDGKRFFGDDPKMATRNLPANMIDKIQVVDDKDQIALNNDGDMTNIGKVINITLKKNIKKALFGKVAAGGGSNERYELSGIINSFRDTLQLSLIGFSNNINRSSFSVKDVTTLGGFDRSGTNNISRSDNSFAINGVSFGGNGAGLSKVNGIGFNLNHAPSKKVAFYAQYFYGNVHTVIDQTQNTKQFVADTTINTFVESHPVNDGNSHNANAGGNWRPNSLSNLNFNVNYSHIDNLSNTPSALMTTNNKFGALSSSNGVLLITGKSSNYSHSFNFTKRFKSKRARQLSVSHFLFYNANPVDNITENINTYYYPTVGSTIFQQLRSANSPVTGANLVSSYSDAITPKLTLRLNEKFEYYKNVKDVITFGTHGGDRIYDSLNTSLSNNLSREQSRLNNNATLSYRVKQVNINFGTTFLKQWINNSFSVTNNVNSKQEYSNLLMNLNANWKRFSIGFSQDVQAPQINYLIPVPDNSNPFYIIYGNPDLKPAKRTSANFNGNAYNPKANLNFSMNISSTFTDNYIIQAITVDNYGVQTLKPVNVNGVSSNSVSIDLNKQYKRKQGFNLTVQAGGAVGISKTPIIYNNQMSGSSTYFERVSTGLQFNWHDVVEFSPRYSANFNRTVYENGLYTRTDIARQYLQAEFILRRPKKLVWETNIAYSFISQTAPGFPNDNVYWNAAVTYLFFKEDKGQLKLSVYDILNSNNNVSSYVNGNSIIDTRTNVLQRFVMLTFSYNIRSLGNEKVKVGGRQNLFLF